MLAAGLLDDAIQTSSLSRVHGRRTSTNTHIYVIATDGSDSDRGQRR